MKSTQNNKHWAAWIDFCPKQTLCRCLLFFFMSNSFEANFQTIVGHFCPILIALFSIFITSIEQRIYLFVCLRKVECSRIPRVPDGQSHLWRRPSSYNPRNMPHKWNVMAVRSGRAIRVHSACKLVSNTSRTTEYTSIYVGFEVRFAWMIPALYWFQTCYGLLKINSDLYYIFQTEYNALNIII